MILSTGLERQLFFFFLKKRSFVQNAIYTLSFDQHVHFYTIYFGYRYTAAKGCVSHLYTQLTLSLTTLQLFMESSEVPGCITRPSSASSSSMLLSSLPFR